jgi:predicted nucleotidyltransferase
LGQNTVKNIFKIIVDIKKIFEYNEKMSINIPSKYQHDVVNATNLLKSEGCEAVFLFGSLVTGKIRDDSDIDIGVKGLPKGKFLSLYSKLYFDFENKIDLVDFDMNSDFYSMLKSIEEVVQIG